MDDKMGRERALTADEMQVVVRDAVMSARDLDGKFSRQGREAAANAIAARVAENLTARGVELSSEERELLAAYRADPSLLSIARNRQCEGRPDSVLEETRAARPGQVDPELCRELARKCTESTTLFASEAKDVAIQLLAAADLAERLCL